MLVMVMMLVIVAAAGAFLAVFVMVVMVVIVAAAVFAMLVMVMMLMLLHHGVQLGIEGVLLSHSLHQLLAGELIPVSGHDGSSGIARAQTLDAVIELFLGEALCVTQDQAACMCDLVVEEFTEILLVHLALLGIDNGGEAVQLHVLGVKIAHRLDDVAELANAGRFDEDAVGLVVIQYLLERLAEVADQTAADAAGIHLGDLHARILQEAAVNADLAEFVLDQDELFAGVALCDELLDERGLAGTEKAGEYGNLCHRITLLSIAFCTDPNASVRGPIL